MRSTILTIFIGLIPVIVMFSMVYINIQFKNKQIEVAMAQETPTEYRILKNDLGDFVVEWKRPGASTWARSMFAENSLEDARQRVISYKKIELEDIAREKAKWEVVE